MMESSACDLWKVQRQLVSLWGELLDRSVFVPLCLEEMARPDWEQKAKHLANTCHVVERGRSATEAPVKVTLLFQTERESPTGECLTVHSGHDGKWTPATRQVLIQFPLANHPSCESSSLSSVDWCFKGLKHLPTYNKTDFWRYFPLPFIFTYIDLTASGANAKHTTVLRVSVQRNMKL